MKPTQLFICAILMTAPVLCVVISSSQETTYQDALKDYGPSPWLFNSTKVDEGKDIVRAWPPVKRERYPDLVLADQNGDSVRLSHFEGKVILLELAAVPCPGCQAFAGGNDRGGLAGVAPQANLDSIHRYAQTYAGVDLKNDDVVFVQLLLYGKSMRSPTQAEVTSWAKHFEMDRQQNQIVLKGTASMLGKASFDMIPGFHLIDRNFVLQFDSSGHHPEDDLFRELLPALGQMVD